MAYDDVIVLLVLLCIMWLVFSFALIRTQHEIIREQRETIRRYETTILRGSVNPDWQAYFDRIRL